MADGVYEVTSVLGGKLVDFAGHMKRLARSLGELDIAAPVSDDEMLTIHREIVRRNGVEEGIVYLQVSRGVADRDFLIPKDITPSLVLFSQVKSLVKTMVTQTGIKVITREDIRWQRRDIKTVQLLASSLGKTEAAKAGKDDAWLVEDGLVTEGTANNAYIVTRDGTIVTRDLSNAILHGITRAAVLRFARESQMKIEERPFTVAEAQNAAEAFITAASTFVAPVVEIDGVKIGDGKPGPVALRLREIYIEESLKTAV